MAYEMKDNEITIFKNERCEGKQPQYRGVLMIDGEEKDVALWVKTAKSGKKYMSGKVSEKYRPENKVEDSPAQTEEPDDLPF